MAPAIRIDEDVYRWLQENAKPFEDTPNSVLRRIAGLDAAHAKGGDGVASEVPRRRSGSRSGITGQQLNTEWKVGAQHALYHAEGTWYENLQRFPGAYFDRNGYIVFGSREDYMGNTQIKVGKKTNVLRGISNMQGYVRKR